jgi:HlyD family secretion protein
MTRAVRGLGVVTTPSTAELKVAETQIRDIKAGQAVLIQTRGSKELFSGVVTGIRDGATNGTITVDVHMPEPHPLQAVDGTIEIERLTNVLTVGRPVFGQPNSEATLFKIEPDGKQAVRVKVQFGRTSVNQIEIRSGLQPGDKVILSDTSGFDRRDRINLK